MFFMRAILRFDCLSYLKENGQNLSSLQTHHPVQGAVNSDSLETAPEKELDTGPVKEVEAPPNGVIAEEDPPKGVSTWLKLTAPAPDPEVSVAGPCCSCVGSGP